MSATSSRRWSSRSSPMRRCAPGTASGGTSTRTRRVAGHAGLRGAGQERRAAAREHRVRPPSPPSSSANPSARGCPVASIVSGTVSHTPGVDEQRSVVGVEDGRAGRLTGRQPRVAEVDGLADDGRPDERRRHALVDRERGDDDVADREGGEHGRAGAERLRAGPRGARRDRPVPCGSARSDLPVRVRPGLADVELGPQRRRRVPPRRRSGRGCRCARCAAAAARSRWWAARPTRPARRGTRPRTSGPAAPG